MFDETQPPAWSMPIKSWKMCETDGSRAAVVLAPEIELLLH
jgi:hypothetical protein